MRQRGTRGGQIRHVESEVTAPENILYSGLPSAQTHFCFLLFYGGTQELRDKNNNNNKIAKEAGKSLLLER